MTKTYGFIGLGQLGGKLAACLLRAGFSLRVSDLDKAAAAPLLAAGAVWAASPAEAASGVDALITCLPSPQASAVVMLGEDGKDGALAALKPGATWIEMSTTEAAEIKRLGELAAARGVAVLEAPVTGGVHRAAPGEITCLVGGEAAVLEAQRPALEAMCGPIFHLGGLGAASVLKVITNMLAFVDLVALGEAMTLAGRGGLDLTQAYRAIRASSGNSVEFETVTPVVLSGTYNTGFTLALGCKDLGFVTALGRELGVPLVMAELVEKTFAEAREKYGAEAWTPHVVKMMEEATGQELRAPGFPAVMTEGGGVN